MNALYQAFLVAALLIGGNSAVGATPLPAKAERTSISSSESYTAKNHGFAEVRLGLDAKIWGPSCRIGGFRARI
jgi:hypothetical protein